MCVVALSAPSSEPVDAQIVTGKVAAKAETQSDPLAPSSAAQSDLNIPTTNFPDELFKESASLLLEVA